MGKTFSLVAFAVIAALVASMSERVLCLLVECDMELVGYIFNDPTILIAYTVISVVLCFIPSVWLSKKIGVTPSSSIIPLIMAVLVMFMGVKNNTQSVAIMGFCVFVPLLAGNLAGLHLWPKLSANLERGNA